MKREVFEKQRMIWRPAALRLLREQPCADYARATVPRSVDGLQILFPITESSYGVRVRVRTQLLEGGAVN